MKEKLCIKKTLSGSRERDLAIIVLAAHYHKKNTLLVTEARNPNTAFKTAMEAIFQELGLSKEPEHACEYAVKTFDPKKNTMGQEIFIYLGKGKARS